MGGSPLLNETNRNLRLSAVDSSKQGEYTVVADQLGGVAEGQITFLVLDGPFLAQNSVRLARSSRGYLLEYQGESGRTYQIQRKSDLAGPNWPTLYTTNAPVHGLIQFEDINPPAGMGYYRVTAP